MERIRIAVAALAVAGGTLAGCGGGGGGSDDPAVLPNVAWARAAGGTNTAAPADVGTFADGSSIAVGFYDGVSTFGEGEPNETTLSAVSVWGETFLARYDDEGSLVWARRGAGPGYMVPEGVAVHADGSFTVTGVFSDTLVFGPGEANETTLVGDPISDVFVARYAASGNLLWARRAGADGLFESGLRVAALSDGSVAVVGMHQGSAVFGEGEATETTLPEATGFTEGFVARYAADGAFLWARTSATEGGSSGMWAVAGLVGDSIAVLAQWNGSITVGAGEANQTSVPSLGDSDDVLLCRYGPNGTLAWARAGGGPLYDEAYAVAGAADGSIRITGDFSDSCTFGLEGPNPPVTLTGTGPQHLYLASYDAAGGLQWATQGSGAGESIGVSVRCLPDGSCVVAGEFGNVVTLGEGEADETMLTAAGGKDVLVARFAADGTLAWASSAGGIEADGGTGVHVLADQSCVVVGSFTHAALFGAGDPNETLLTGAGTSDAFVARFNPDGGF
jgi:hypothetical protein